MDVAISGSSGLIGTALQAALAEAGHRPIRLVRRDPEPGADEIRFVPSDGQMDGPSLEGVDAVVNLAGRTIFKRWSRAYKAQIVDSRILTTRNVVGAMMGEGKILISTSAVGYYGSRGDQVLTEHSTPGADFLAQLSVDWEEAALDAEQQGVRVAIMRFGVVLGAGGGALAQMLPVFRRFAGGPLGSGRQWFSWTHMADLLAAWRHRILRSAAFSLLREHAARF